MAISIHLWAQCAARSCSKEFIDSSNFLKHHISYAWAAALCSPHLVMLYASHEPLLPCALNKTSQLVCLGTHCFVLNTIPTLSITRSITPPLSRSASTPLCSFQHNTRPLRFPPLQNSSDLRYHTWTPEECHAYECLNRIREAGLIVDIPTVTTLLRDKLPQVLKGVPVDKIREPWPLAV